MEFPNLKHFDRIGYDTETTGLRYKVDKVFGFSIALPDGRDFYYDIRQTPQAADWIQDELLDWNGSLVMHNASFDYRFSLHTGIALPLAQVVDTAVRATLINEHEWMDHYGNAPYSLDQLAIKYLKEKKYGDIYQELADIFGGKPTRKAQMPNLHLAPPEVVEPYAKQDPRVTLNLYDWQDKEIERQGITAICDFERELTPTIIRAEMRGVHVDLDYTEQAIAKLDPVIDEAYTNMNSLAGFELNVRSPKQVREAFGVKYANGNWQTRDGFILPETGGGQASMGADVLREIDNPLSNAIIDLRSIVNTRDTFLKTHVQAHSINGVVYPNINQTKGPDGGTGTGRLSYTDPALQQIPSRNKKTAAIVKPCFIPPPGYVWVDCDKASFEVRVFLDLVGNKDMIEKYRKNPSLDGHQFVANLTGLVRNATYAGEPNAKQLNLSMIFNQGNGATAMKMGLPWEWDKFLPRGKSDKEENYIHYRKPGKKAMEIINRYHARMPGVKELAENCKDEVLLQGWEETYFGRRLRFPDKRFAYKASGLKIQATAADLNKENWMIVERQLEGVGHLILNTHDSYGMALPEDWEPHYERVKAEIEEPGRLDIPLVLDWSGAGYNWWEALQGENNVKRKARRRSATQ